MITRDNYEEWFLLYADNELTVADRQLVERFVAGNPDLGEELKALLQCRLDPKDAAERFIFTDKLSLMRYEQRYEYAGTPNDEQVSAINTGNYEELFLQYIDGELDGAKRLEVEEFIRRHPAKGAELELLQQTVCRPDTNIVFPDKEGLYKRPTGRKVVFYPWWRIATAAVVLGATALLILYSVKKTTPAVTPVTPSTFYSSETQKGTGVDKTNDSGENKKASGPAIAQQGDQRRAVNEKGNGDTPTPTEKRSDRRETVLAQTIPVKKTAKDVNNNPGHEDVAGKVEDSRNGQQKGDPGDGHRNGSTGDAKDGRRNEGVDVVVTGASQYNRNAALNGKPLRPEDNAIVAGDPPKKNGASFVDAGIPKEKSSFATQALLNDATTSAEDSPDTEPASPKKTKLRGFFRKVSRAFEKTADRGEESQKKILIGSFQFALN